MSMSGMIHKDNVQLLKTHLALSKPVVKDFLTVKSKQGITSGVDFKKLLFEVDVGILAKAFIFYGLGCVLLPTRTRVGQPHYLPLLGEKRSRNMLGGSRVGPHQG